MSEISEKTAKRQVGLDGIQFREDGKIKAILALIFGIVGLIFLFIEKDDQFVRYYSAMSVLLIIAGIATSIVFSVLSVIPGVGCITGIIAVLLWPAYLVFIIIAIIKANNGEVWKIPTVTDYVLKLMNAV